VTATARAEIRVAGPADRDLVRTGVLAFRDHLGAARPTDEEIETALPAALRDPSIEFCCAVAAEGAALGYTQTRFFRSVWVPGEEAHLEDLFVMEEARRSGLGRRLLAFALDRSRARGALLMGLTTNEHNEAGQALYRALGFAPQSHPRWRGGREVRWVRSLEDGA